MLTNLPRTIVAYDFSPSSFRLQRRYPFEIQNKYSNLKTACHIKPKFFLWTKHLENLLLSKYLLSVAVASRSGERVTSPPWGVSSRFSRFHPNFWAHNDFSALNKVCRKSNKSNDKWLAFRMIKFIGKWFSAHAVPAHHFDNLRYLKRRDFECCWFK